MSNITLTELLKREEGVESTLFFYNIDGSWCAFERSAYLAELMFGKAAVRQFMYIWEEDGLPISLATVEVDRDMLGLIHAQTSSDGEEAKVPFQVLPGKLRYWKKRMRERHSC